MTMSILGALALDVLLGEPPARFHPTIAMGNVIGKYKPKHVPRDGTVSLLEGCALIAGGVAGVTALAILADKAIRRAPRGTRTIAKSIALKPAFSLRPLLRAGEEIERALRARNLAEARRLLAWHLVSRDTSELTPSEVAGAAIESLAENLSDSFIAPLLAYKLGGLPAAYAYRFINTADAMLGYRTPELEKFGKCAARADDVANYLPARLTALLIASSAPLIGGSWRRAFSVARNDARRTTSPNAGWPMAAMAGALNCRLTKRGVYQLHDRGRTPTLSDLRNARHLVASAATLGVALLSAWND